MFMAERLCDGNVGHGSASQLVGPGSGLVAMILTFGPQPGAHLHRVVTLALQDADPDSGLAVDCIGYPRLLRGRAPRLGVVRR